jgi:hypothetical protein
MAVKTGVASQALGYVEEKLRRVFNIAGPIDASLDATMRPVIIVDDLRDPGHAFYQGRSWVHCYATQAVAIAATNVLCVHFMDDCIVEGISVTANVAAATSIGLYQVDPDRWYLSPPGGSISLGGVNVAWRDRLMSQTDRPPVEADTNFKAIGGGQGDTNQNRILNLIQANYVAATFPVKAFMPRGSALVWIAGTAINIPMTLAMWGRVFPQ